MIRFFACVFLVANLSCGKGPSAVLIDNADMQGRLDERTRRMALTVVGPSGEEGAMTASDFVGYLEQHVCGDEVPDAWVQQLLNTSVTLACRTALDVQLRQADCVAQLLLEAAENEQPLEQSYEATTGTTHITTYPVGWVLPPQLPEARIALASEAARVAQEAIWAAGDTIRESVRIAAPSASINDGRIMECEEQDLFDDFSYTGPDGAALITPVALVAEVLTAASGTLQHAITVEARYQTAVAEAERSRSTSPATAASLGWVNPAMSRVSFVKHLLGGVSGDYYGFDEGEGLCPVDEPDGSVLEGIRFLRSMGTDPREVLNPDIDLDVLALGGAGVTTSFADRQSDLSGDAPVLTADAVFDAAGVRPAAITSARRYLREEARAFATLSVPMESGIPLSPVPDGLGGVEERKADAWAGLARAPSAPPAMYYIGASWQPTPSDIVSVGNLGYATPADVDYAETSLVATLDFATSVATDHAGRTGPTGGYYALPVDARRRLRPLVETAAARVPARIQVCGAAGYDYLWIDVLGRDASYTNAARLRIVQGVSGLRCAVDGDVQGENCDLSAYTVTPSSASMGTATDQTAGFQTYAALFMDAPSVGTGAVNELPQEAAERDFIYILRPTGDTDDIPGTYEAIGVHRLGNTGNYCVKQPVAPTYNALAGSILRPSTAFCGTTEATCAGPDFAERIPLENEITGDDGGQGLENSWQYWLGLAEDTANRADLLGESLLTSGEVLDESIEDVEERLSTLCGGPVDFRDAYFDMLDEAPPGPPSPSCAVGYDEVDGNCVRDITDLLAGPQFETLRECLGAETVINYVAAGSRPVCGWELDGTLCGTPDYDPMMPQTFPACPWVVGDGATDCGTPAMPAGAVVLSEPISTTLGIFETDDPQGLTEPEGPFDCRMIRQLRNSTGPAREAIADELIRAPEFGLESMQRWARRMGYRAFPDDYGQITLDNKRWRGLGLPRPAAMPPSEWPCNQEAAAGCTPGDDSLFCVSANGHCEATTEAERTQRARMNHRMARAVLAMKLLTGQDAANVELPYRPEPHWLTSEANREQGSGPDASGNDYNELWEWNWQMESAGDVLNLRGGRSLAVGDRIVYHTAENDATNEDRADLPVDGRTYCLATGASSSWLWTHFTDHDLQNSVQVFAPCTDDGDSFRHLSEATPPQYATGERTQGIVFRGNAGTAEAGSVGTVAVMWEGMGGQTAGSASTQRVRLTDALRGRLAGNVAERPDCVWRDEQGFRCDTDGPGRNAAAFTSYWSSGNNESNNYNDIRMMDDGISQRDLLDGLELTCELMADDLANPSFFEPSACGDWDALVEGSVSNLRQGQRLMACMAHEIDKRGETQVFQDMPESALEVIRGSQSIPGTRGELLHSLATQLNALAGIPTEIAGQLRTAGLLMQRARIAAGRNETRQELNEVERQSTQMREATSCIAASFTAAGQAASGSTDSFGAAGASFIAAAAATCANSIGQIVLAKQREALQNELSDFDQQTELNIIAQQLGDTMDQLKRIARTAQDMQISLRGTLSGLEAQRTNAMNEIADALTTYGNTSATSTLRRRRYNTLEERYQEAHQRAIGTAWLARRALEQRLGRSLSNFTDDMPLVDAPSEWADTLCTMGGMNYQQITRDYDLPGGDSYAREYVGDYVRRLRSVFDSYSVAHPFVTGDDTAVVSLRDDVVHARAQCDSPVRNLLAFSGELNVASDPDYLAPPPQPDGAGTVLDRSAPEVWRRDGCAPYTATVADGDGGTTTIDRLDGCIGFSRLDGIEDAPLQLSPEFGSPNGWQVTFGGESVRDVGESSYTPAAQIAQRVLLPAGTYRLSWRSREYDPDPTDLVDGTFEVDPFQMVSVKNAAGVELSGANLARMTTVYSDGGWNQYYLFFALSGDEEVDVVIRDTGSASATVSTSANVAALMLENVTAEIGGTVTGIDDDADPHQFPPMPYIETRLAGMASFAVCEDTDGSVFRTRWRRDCTRLCPGGGEACAEGRLACFWELPFTVSQNDLEFGGQLANSGFANGNYNYRWNTLSANVVGTGVRDCEGSTSPSACYGSGYVPISIYHDGGFDVRNHWGELYEAPLFDGRLEHARALSAERFLTNPLSSADRALVEPYTRYEMRGRPLAGRYRMRIWDEPGIRFDRIEDVQVVLNYRYWTRLD